MCSSKRKLLKQLASGHANDTSSPAFQRCAEHSAGLNRSPSIMHSTQNTPLAPRQVRRFPASFCESVPAAGKCLGHWDGADAAAQKTLET